MSFDKSGGSSRLKRLRCSVQNYDWGRIGRQSSVARLFSSSSGAEIDESRPYAELWMGTHDSGPSFLLDPPADIGSKDSPNFVTLKSWIQHNPSVLGDKVVQKWGSNLPFLFKVLSISKALSIQAHPDKGLAEVLHKAQPNVYKDDNHKPEMALALTEFEALCGFISLQELKAVLQSVPEIVEVVGSAYIDKVLQIEKQDGEDKAKAVLRSLFTELMSASKDIISQVLSKLISRMNKENKERELSDKELLILRLERQYPADVGVIAAFLFNYVKLNPGEALYLAANELHAYISGECIECMATSDNVVRAGLTPKSRDIQTLCSMLTYNQGFPEILGGAALDSYTKRYLPPFNEFEVDCSILPQGASTVVLPIPGPSIFLVISGEGSMRTISSEDVVSEGDVLFAPANTEINVTAKSKLQFYRAGVNSTFFLTLVG